MPKYCVQVLCNVRGSPEKQWVPVGPAGGPLYQFDTEEAAEKVMRMCYPDQVAFGEGKVRVQPIPEGVSCPRHSSS